MEKHNDRENFARDAARGFITTIIQFLFWWFVASVVVIFAFFALTSPAEGATGDPLLGYQARVTGVYDGDTVTLLRLPEQSVVKLRLSDVDTPELCQPGGKAARDYLRRTVLGQVVTIQTRKGLTHGRSVGAIIHRGANVNLALVRDGWAWRYDEYSRDPTYEAAERGAVLRKVGIWAAGIPTPPWEWRKLVRAGKIKVSYRSSIDSCVVKKLSDDLGPL